MRNRKFYISEDDFIFGGVCGGLGECLGVDSTLIRLLFALSTLFCGVGPVLYLLLLILGPRKDE